MARLRGIIAPILTPFEDDGQIAEDLWQAHAGWVLGQGAHYLTPFGTTGEALSLSMPARMVGLRSLIDAGIPPSSLMPGTGLTSLDDTVTLTSHAVDQGVKAVMVLPSFFYPDAGDEGHFRYFAALVEGVRDDRLKICLYNIPQNSGVPISSGLAARLSREFPSIFVAYKDSTGMWANTLSVIEAAPGLAVFPGTEALIVQAMEHGGAGCISATVNLNARALRDVYDGVIAGGDIVAGNDAVNQFRAILQNAGLIPAMKAVLAVRYDDARWLNLRPPLLNATEGLGYKVLAELGDLAEHIVKTG